MFDTVTFLLFCQLGVGGLWSISFVPDEASKGFFRFCGSACATLLAVGLFVGNRIPFWSLLGLGTCLGLTVVFVVLVVLDRPRQARLFLVAAGVSGAAGLAAQGYLTVPPSWPVWVSGASVVYQLSSALFLGSILFAMTLGHWYLVLPKLSVAPLRKLTLLMIFATGIKTLLVAAVVTSGAYSAVPEIADTIASFARIQGLFFWARCLFGLLGPIAICYMTWETVKLNATQSATGLLYVATVLVLIGETLSRFIYYTTQLPV